MAKKVKKEIKIEKKPEHIELVVNGKPKDPCLEGQFPIGSVVNGVNVVEKQTDTSSYLSGEDNNSIPYRPDETLSEDEEKKITEKIDKERFEKILDRTEELKKPYSPRENVDLKAFADFPVKDLIKLAGNFARMYKEKAAELREQEFKNDWAISEEKKKTLEELVERIQNPRPYQDYLARVADTAYKADKVCKKEYVAPECACATDFIPDTTRPKMELSFANVADDLIQLHERKNSDYGDAAHESFKEFGLISYVIRLNDKLNRLKALTKPGAKQKVKEESVVDTLKDLASYAIMAIESLSRE